MGIYAFLVFRKSTEQKSHFLLTSIVSLEQYWLTRVNFITPPLSGFNRTRRVPGGHSNTIFVMNCTKDK